MARKIGINDIENLSVGAAILGTGGGGDPYIGKLMAIDAIKNHGEVNLISPEEVPDSECVIPTGMMGAPTILIEKVPNGNEIMQALQILEKYINKKAYATMPYESGGLNSTIPFNVAARVGIPVVDADGMGRAFPEMYMKTFHIYGKSGTPMSITDEKGNFCILNTKDNFTFEWIARGITMRMGGDSHIAEYPMSGKDVKKVAIPGTVSLGINLGKSVNEATVDPLGAIMDVTENSFYGKAIVLFKGKIIDVERKTTSGFAVGNVKIEGFDEYINNTLAIRFQNENLAAVKNDEVIATVPDLITVLDAETALPITTEYLRYGSRVTVIGIPTPEIMRTNEALEVWGPKHFGYKDLEYIPLELRHKQYYSNAKLSKEKEIKYGKLLKR